MGGGANVTYGPKATDRKLALDAKRERRERRDFLKRFPEAARLESRPGDFANFGDQPEPLAMDEADADDSEFFKMFPDARRIGFA
jgi:hypothetical protein